MLYMVIRLCVSYVLEGFVLDQFPCGCERCNFIGGPRGLWRMLVALIELEFIGVWIVFVWVLEWTLRASYFGALRFLHPLICVTVGSH